MYVLMNTYIYIYIHIHLDMYICIYIHMYMCVYIYIYILSLRHWSSWLRLASRRFYVHVMLKYHMYIYIYIHSFIVFVVYRRLLCSCYVCLFCLLASWRTCRLQRKRGRGRLRANKRARLRRKRLRHIASGLSARRARSASLIAEVLTCCLRETAMTVSMTAATVTVMVIGMAVGAIVF